MKYCSDRTFGCRYMISRINGKRLLLLENEMLRVTILPDNGCDIADFNYKPTDLSFLWRTRQGISSVFDHHPHYSDRFNQTYHGGWFEAFPNVGLACNYQGFSFEPYDEVKYLSWNMQVMKDDPHEVIIRFSVSTLKTPFLVQKTIRLRSGSPALEIEGTIENTGRESFPWQWGHHPLLGYPFLSGDCVIDLEGAQIDTFFEFDNARVKQGIKGSWPIIEGKNGPVDLRKFPAQKADINDLYWLSKLENNFVAVRNIKRNIGFGIAWDKDVFDHCLLWINANGDKGFPHYGRAYTLCIMPSSTGTHTLETAGSEKKLKMLKPGESESVWITACVFTSVNKPVRGIRKNGLVSFNND